MKTIALTLWLLLLTLVAASTEAKVAEPGHLRRLPGSKKKDCTDNGDACDEDDDCCDSDAVCTPKSFSSTVRKLPEMRCGGQKARITHLSSPIASVQEVLP